MSGKLLSMLDKKDTTLDLHENWGQFYFSNLPEVQGTNSLGSTYESIAIFFDGDNHNLTFMRKLQTQVAQAIQWLEQQQTERRPTTCDTKGGSTSGIAETEA